MAKKDKNETQQPAEEQELPVEETTETEQAAPEVNPWEEKYNAEHDSFLRLAADYDNFRKRTIKEKELSYGNGKADAVEKLLPVYDNLERALNQPTEDEAYKKGVEMTMTQLREVFTSLGIEEIPALGQTFDPGVHNAVLHIDDESFGENEIVEVFQAGFRCGEKVIRFSMVKVAN